jgi:hypothetical protein
MFVSCVVSKEKNKMQDIQDKETCADEVRTEYKRMPKKILWGVGMFVLYVVSRDKKAKCRTRQTKKTSMDGV